MASLVEFQDLNQTYQTARTGMLQDPECCDVHALDEIIGFEPLPTPPLSPEPVTSAPTSKGSYSAESVSIDDHAEALLNEMLQCEQITSFDDDEFSVDSQNSYCSSSVVDLITDIGADLLIQDCMWNSHAYEPRNLFGNVNGVYTPAPSPPPPTAKVNQDEPSSKDDTSEEMIEDTITMEQSSDVQSECISPNDIFPTCLLVAGPQGENLKPGTKVSEKPKVRSKTTSGSLNKRALSNVSSETGRTHPQATSSESEEEIDVVTVTERPQTRMNNRKRLHSLSAPCSRQSSPNPPSPKKRKYNPKRLQRISSTCSSVGDGTESDDEHRRASHNILERKRRNDLKYSFQVLREQVPDLEDNQRAPKVTILRKAAEYIKRIQGESDSMEQVLDKERKREAKLRQRLAFLKAMPAAC